MKILCLKHLFWQNLGSKNVGKILLKHKKMLWQNEGQGESHILARQRIILQHREGQQGCSDFTCRRTLSVGLPACLVAIKKAQKSLLGLKTTPSLGFHPLSGTLAILPKDLVKIWGFPVFAWNSLQNVCDMNSVT